jgi:hypothetical protein
MRVKVTILNDDYSVFEEIVVEKTDLLRVIERSIETNAALKFADTDEEAESVEDFIDANW